MEHFRYPLYALFPATLTFDHFIEAGYLGVEIFFVLSGFIIAYTYAHQFERLSWATYRRFMFLRLARIYPVHIIMLFIVLGLVISASIADIQLNSSSEYTAGNFIANALMLQAVPPYEAWNGPAWSVCAELAAYLAFPLIALWIARIRVAIHGFLASAIVLVTGTGVMLVTATYVNPSPTGYELIWLRISTEFTAGALIYGGWRHLGRFKQGSGWDWMAGISFFGIAVIIWITEEANQFALASVPLIGVFILSCAGATGWIGSILRCRFMVWGGKVSYSVYMTHFILLMVFGKVLPWEAFEDAALPLRLGVMGGYYLLVILTGAVCFYLLEEPARRGLRRLSDARLVGQPLEKFRQRSTRT